MKTILITDFEPFANDAVNPSWQAVKSLPDQDGEWTIIKQELPVVFEQAGKKIVSLIEQYQPDAVIATGYNAAADQLNLEYAGLNLDHARIADNDGQMPLQKRIDDQGPLARQSRLPVFELEKKLNARGIPARVSFSAGTYVCNHVMYLLLGECEKRNIPGGFIHIPPLKDQECLEMGAAKAGAMDKKLAVDGLLEVVRAL